MAMGKGDNGEAEKILGNSFFLQVIMSAVLTAVLLLFNRPLLLAFGASTNTIGYAAAYMGIYAVGTIFVQLTLGMNAFITAQGFAKTGMMSVLISLIYILPHFVENQTMGVYLAEPVADVIAVTFTAVLFYSQFRKELKKIG